MVLKEINEELSAKAGIYKKDATKITRVLLDIIKDELTDEGVVKIDGFGKFVVTNRPGGKYKNVKTGEMEDYPAYNRVYFYAFKELKERVNDERET